MPFSYKTEKLLNDGVDFSKVFADKQDAVKEMTGYNFSLESIVGFLKTQTNGFKTQNELAMELDRGIYSIYLKYADKAPSGSGSPPPTPTPEPKPSPAPKKTKKTKAGAASGAPEPGAETETEKAKIMAEIADIEGLLEFVDADDKAKLEKEINDLQGLLEIL